LKYTRFLKLIACAAALLGFSVSTTASDPDPHWGRLANQELHNKVIKTTLFFSGQARDGSNPYGCNPASNLSLYTVHPADNRHLNWFTDVAHRTLVIDEMLDVGINVVTMSSWGEAFLPCTSGWAPWAPMQTAPQSHNELFDAVVGKPILVMPFIESRADWTFYNEFPTWTDGRVAPGTVSQINELVNRYLKNPGDPAWPAQWARVYDRDGNERYAVAIIHASSNRLGSSEHAAYAAGFGAVAQEVYSATGVRVGFFLDALPPGTGAPGSFKPSPEVTGPYLKQEPSILGIMCFIPEVWVGSSNDNTLIAWKEDFSGRWADTGIPFIMDISPGYDAHIVFPGSVQYGLNSSWTSALSQMVNDFGQDGLTFNSWNGYTEAMAAVPTQEFGDVYYEWLRSLPRHPADFDWDDDVDLEDFGRFQICLGHPAFPVADPDCDACNLNDDSDVDLDDLAVFRGCLTGANIAVDRSCMD